jgi:hypothetical protein
LVQLGLYLGKPCPVVIAVVHCFVAKSVFFFHQ